MLTCCSSSGHSDSLFYFLKLNTRDFFNIIFFISPGNILYHYSLSSSFCSSSEHFMPHAKFRLISYFSVLTRSFPRWMVGPCLGMSLYPVKNILTWGQRPARIPQRRQRNPRRAPCTSPRGRTRGGRTHDEHSEVLGLTLSLISVPHLWAWEKLSRRWFTRPRNERRCAAKPLACPQPAAVTAGEAVPRRADLSPWAVAGSCISPRWLGSSR